MKHVIRAILLFVFFSAFAGAEFMGAMSNDHPYISRFGGALWLSISLCSLAALVQRILKEVSRE